jgi:hypothetical protein
MAKNEQAVRLYEQYLTFYIPALRWTHEYCEHVKYFADHTRIARGKMEHHEEKLRVYIESIGNILEDLEGDYDNPFTDYEDERREERVVSSGRRPDHKHAFCSSRANVAYYSIIEQDQLARLYRDVPADDSARYYQ